MGFCAPSSHLPQACLEISFGYSLVVLAVNCFSCQKACQERKGGGVFSGPHRVSQCLEFGVSPLLSLSPLSLSLPPAHTNPQH